MNLPVTPDEMLSDLYAALVDERPPAVTTREWFTAGLLRAIRRDEPMEYALRLANPGGGRSTSLSRRLRLQKRDVFLVCALRAIALDEGVSLWSRCDRVSAEIDRFTRSEWLPSRYLDTPTKHWSQAREMIWRAMHCDVGVPRNAKGLYAATYQRWHCLNDNDGGTLLSNYL